MSSIMEQIKPEHLELFTLEFGKIVESDFVYTLASTNIDQSTPNLEKLLNPILFTLYHLQIITSEHQTWPKCMLP